MRLKFTLLFSIILTVFAGCTGLGQHSTELERGPEIERGRYVVEIMGCNDCHTPDYMGSGASLPEEDWLVGGALGFHGSWGTAYPTNLRLLLNGISEDDWLILARRMRQSSPMSWVRLPKVTDQDLRAVYRFVKYLGPKGTPAPARLPAGVIPTTDYLEFPEPH
jgi:mono/diheme cytochrome c family protein